MSDDFHLHALAGGRNRRRPARASRPVITIRVNPGVFREALRLAGRDAARLSPNSLNYPNC
jgi:hypothetical protein